MYALREKRLCGEIDDAATTIIQAWRERLPQLCYGYGPQNILNLDERLKMKKSKIKVGKNRDRG